MVLADERELLGLAQALGAAGVGAVSSEERLVLAGAARPSPALVAAARAQIVAGEDPLGDAFCRLRSPESRRPQGATYTPAPIVESMVNWAKTNCTPMRVVDPGIGSGRF